MPSLNHHQQKLRSKSTQATHKMSEYIVANLIPVLLAVYLPQTDGATLSIIIAVSHNVQVL